MQMYHVLKVETNYHETKYGIVWMISILVLLHPSFLFSDLVLHEHNLL